MYLRLIYNNISKLTEILGHGVSVRYKIGYFGYHLINDFHYKKILGTSCICLHFLTKQLFLMYFNI